MYRTAYPHLRASLDPQYIELSDEQLDYLVAELYGAGVTAEDVESFWRDVGRGFSNVARGVGRFAQKAAPVVGRALPSIAQGAMSGATVAGPWGALAGAVAGGAGGIMSQSRNRTLRGIGGAIGGVTQLAGSVTGGGALGGLAGGTLGRLAGTALGAGAAAAPGRRGRAVPRGRDGAAALGRLAGNVAPQLAGVPGGAGGGSANALFGMLARPETLRALSSAAMGQFGRSQVPIGGRNVPVQSILGALGTLAGNAAAEAERADGHAHPEHFYAADGELAIDPADAEQRAYALLELYAATPSPYLMQWAREEAEAMEAAEAEAESDEFDEAEYGAEDAIYDEWLLANEAAWNEYDEVEPERAHV